MFRIRQVYARGAIHCKHKAEQDTDYKQCSLCHAANTCEILKLTFNMSILQQIPYPGYSIPALGGIAVAVSGMDRALNPLPPIVHYAAGGVLATYVAGTGTMQPGQKMLMDAAYGIGGAYLAGMVLRKNVSMY